jgi:NADPH-dependent glutamate synthase beta subunit-like oxidoreductase/2,4-dienoyl-CoA reductase-like NADH-dependent reductase (Old Yellow Enzyme family)
MKPKNPNLFAYRSLDELKQDIKAKGLNIPIYDDPADAAALFKQPLMIEGVECPNRFCIHPLEGCDGDGEGTPSELTVRKYIRFAQGGSGMIWVEATAVVPEGRANPRQLMITEANKEHYKALVQAILENAVDENGHKIRPYLILQLTHSGRYSKPDGVARPMIFHHSPVLDPTHNLPPDYPLVSDDYLDALEGKFVAAAKLAQECGFDAVDIKCTHGYLFHEILSAHTRTDSKYGGSFENRSKLLPQITARIKREVPGLTVATRLNVYDAYAYPYGFGQRVAAPDGVCGEALHQWYDPSNLEPDMSEPIQLIEKLKAAGMAMVNIAFGNPYYNPHIERPYDTPIHGVPFPKEHPLAAVERMINLTREITENVRDFVSVSVGFTWLREYCLHVAAPLLRSGVFTVAGLGRMAMAYPDYANDYFKTGALAFDKTCLTCSSCTQIMRDGGKAGCVIRDGEVYGPLYREGRLNNEAYLKTLADECRTCWGATCKGKCPAGVDAARFIQAFYEGDLQKAYETITEANALPETCSYTCPAEELCQSGCTAQIQDGEAVPVQQLQRFVSGEARKRGYTQITAGKPSGKKAAVVGFGPAGIACAVELVKQGISVTVFEESDKTGGMAEAVIPSARLADGIMDAEVTAFGLDKTGLFEVRYNTALNAEFTVEDVEKQGFDAIFIAAGMGVNTGMPIDEKPLGVAPALNYLYMAKRGFFDLTGVDNAAVIGGGNTAMDAAISLKENGVRNVYLLYRRSFRELPAWPAETEKALNAGVHVMILSQPVGYVADNGKLSGITAVRTVLGEPDASGRCAPVVLEGSEFVLPVDLCVEAVGQKVSPVLAAALPGVAFKDGKITVGPAFQTTRKNVFAGGDIINGGMTVVQAVADGRDAARAMAKAMGLPAR